MGLNIEINFASLNDCPFDCTSLAESGSFDF